MQMLSTSKAPALHLRLLQGNDKIKTDQVNKLRLTPYGGTYVAEFDYPFVCICTTDYHEEAIYGGQLS